MVVNLNPGIILAGHQPDLLESFGQGAEIGARQNDLNRINALREFMEVNGDGVLRGDPNVLSELAKIDVTLATDAADRARAIELGDIELENAREDRDLRRTLIDREMRFEDEDRRIAAEDRSLALADREAGIESETREAERTTLEAERAAALAEVERILKILSAADTPEKWDAFARALGPDGEAYIGRFGDRDMLLAEYREWSDVFDPDTSDVEWRQVAGNMVRTTDDDIQVFPVEGDKPMIADGNLVTFDLEGNFTITPLPKAEETEKPPSPMMSGDTLITFSGEIDENGFYEHKFTEIPQGDDTRVIVQDGMVIALEGGTVKSHEELPRGELTGADRFKAYGDYMYDLGPNGQGPDGSGEPLRMGKIRTGETGSISVFDPDTGEIVFTTADPAEFGTVGDNRLDLDNYNNAKLIQDIQEIEALFEPRFQTAGFRFEMWGDAIADKLGALDPEDQEELRAYRTYTSSVYEAVTSRLNALSGVAITPQEAQRILNYMPNPEGTVWPADSPVEFQAKLSRITYDLKLAAARFYLWDQRGRIGTPAETMEIYEMEDIINARIADLEKSMRDQGMTDPVAIGNAIRGTIEREFGFVE